MIEARASGGLDSLAKPLLGSREISPRPLERGQSVVRFGAPRIQLQSSFEAHPGSIGLPEARERATETVAAVVALRLSSEDPLEGHSRVLWAAEVEQEVPVHGERFRTLRLPLEEESEAPEIGRRRIRDGGELVQLLVRREFFLGVGKLAERDVRRLRRAAEIAEGAERGESAAVDALGTDLRGRKLLELLEKTSRDGLFLADSISSFPRIGIEVVELALGCEYDLDAAATQTAQLAPAVVQPGNERLGVGVDVP